jgi:hypothetical protein
MAEIPVPPEIRDAVLHELYRQVGSLDWDAISGRQKTGYYAQWVEDPAIGGELADYYTADGMRVWLKDGPLKEYARALEGFGPYAKYTTKRLAPPDEFIPSVLGDEWTVVSGSIGEKPMHCSVTDGARERYVCWGNPRTFRDLLWAAVNNAVRASTRPLVVVSLNEEQSITPSQRRLHEQITEHCALDLAYVHRTSEERVSGQ